MSDDAARIEPEFEPIRDDGSPLRRAGYAELTILSALTSALKISRLHTLDNVVAREVLGEFHRYLSMYLSKAGHLQILVSKDRIYVHNAPVRLAKGQSFLSEFIDFIGRLGVAGIQLRGAWSYEACEALISCFGSQPGVQDVEERFRSVAARVKEIPSPALVEVFDAVQASTELQGGEDVIVSDAARAAFFYARLLSLLEENHIAVQRGESVDRYIRHVRQSVMKIVECLEARFFELRLLAHTVTSPEGDPLANHAANVAVLSIVMGRLLGLTRGQLITLGFAALYHDLGRALTGRFPDPPGEREDPEVAQLHIADGVRLSLMGGGLTDAGTMRIVVICEHHRACDGYPKIEGAPTPHLFSRIVSVADAFDKLQNGTPWAKAQNPAQALRTLRREPSRYDGAVVELLQDVLGKTPRGTVLRLLNSELVVVLEGGSRFGHKPIVRRLIMGNGALDPDRSLRQIDLVEVKGEADPELLRIDWRYEVLR